MVIHSSGHAFGVVVLHRMRRQGNNGYVSFSCFFAKGVPLIGEQTLTDLNDFITPSQACIKPVQQTAISVKQQQEVGAAEVSSVWLLWFFFLEGS